MLRALMTKKKKKKKKKCQHSSRDHMNTKAPPLRQNRDTFGGDHISATREMNTDDENISVSRFILSNSKDTGQMDSYLMALM
jgi:hypothetical protein